MKRLKLKRFFIGVALVLAVVLIQTTVLNLIAIANIRPNLIIILTASFGFMRGSKEGMFVGFGAGLLLDILFGNIIGFYALIYLVFGFLNGLFQQIYLDEDIKLPILLISVSSFVYGLFIYFFHFVLRGVFDFFHLLNAIILPELIYTIAATLGLYPFILFINRKLETEEKRRASKFG
ncbi:MAG: rod shape-determining protein MreD [Lachnospiraceae bacterium]|nr:rod shape-determining protein MreD [Lachnospiraceae bacterium]